MYSSISEANKILNKEFLVCSSLFIEIEEKCNGI